MDYSTISNKTSCTEIVDITNGDLTEKYYSLKKQFENLSSNYDAIKQELHEATRNYNTALAGQSYISAELESYQAEEVRRKTELNSRITKLQEDISGLREERTELIESHAKEVKQFETEIRRLKEENALREERQSPERDTGELDEARAALSAALEEAAAAKAALEETRAEIASWRLRSEELVSEMAQMREAAELRREELRAAAEREAAALADLAEARAMLHQCDTEGPEHAAKGNSIFAEVEDKRQEMAKNLIQMKQTNARVGQQDLLPSRISHDTRPFLSRSNCANKKWIKSPLLASRRNDCCASHAVVSSALPAAEVVLKPVPKQEPIEEEKPGEVQLKPFKKEKLFEESTPEELSWRGKRRPKEEQPAEEVVLNPVPKQKPVEAEKPEAVQLKPLKKEKLVEDIKPEEVSWRGKRRPKEEHPAEEVVLKPVPKKQPVEKEKPEEVQLKPIKKEKSIEESTPEEVSWGGKRRPKEEQPAEEVVLKPVPKQKPVEEEKPEEVQLKPIKKEKSIEESTPEEVSWRGKRRPKEEQPAEEVVLKPVPKQKPVEEEKPEEVQLKPFEKEKPIESAAALRRDLANKQSEVDALLHEKHTIWEQQAGDSAHYDRELIESYSERITQLEGLCERQRRELSRWFKSLREGSPPARPEPGWLPAVLDHLKTECDRLRAEVLSLGAGQLASVAQVRDLRRKIALLSANTPIKFPEPVENADKAEIPVYKTVQAKRITPDDVKKKVCFN